MNFYDFHIGDYASRTAHLEPMEDLAYRRMLDLYYVREEALPLDVGDVARLVRLRGQEGVIQAVLDEFFAKTDAGWTHGKCEEVIAAAADKRAKARAAAQLSVEARAKAAGERTLNGRSADAEPTLSGRLAPSPSPSPTTQVNTPQPPKGEPEGFAEFYEAYPRKTARPKAMKAFAKVKVPLATLLAAIERQKRSVLWAKEGGSFIPYPATWLNDERWNDQADVAPISTHPASAVFTAPKPLSKVELAANKAKADQVAASLGIPNMKVKH